MRFARSAFKHGITEEQIRHVVQHWQPPFPVESAHDPTLEVRLFVGDDNRGVALEVIAVDEVDDEADGDEEWDIVVIHAMRLRPIFHRYYLEALAWRRSD